MKSLIPKIISAPPAREEASIVYRMKPEQLETLRTSVPGLEHLFTDPILDNHDTHLEPREILTPRILGNFSLEPYQQKEILIIGAGPTPKEPLGLYRLLSPRLIHVIDLHLKRLERLQRKLLQEKSFPFETCPVLLYQTAAHQLLEATIRKGSIGLVYACGVHNMLDYPRKIGAEMFEQMAAVLEPGGVAILIEASRECASYAERAGLEQKVYLTLSMEFSPFSRIRIKAPLYIFQKKPLKKK